MRREIFYVDREGNDEDFFKITLASDFQFRVQELRYKWGIDTNHRVQNAALAKKENSLFSNRDLRRACFKINKRYGEYVLQYVITDSFLLFENIEGPKLIIENDDHSRRVFLEITSDLTEEKIKNNWAKILSIAKIKKGRKKITPNFRRDHRIYLLAREGKSTDQIYSLIKREFGEVDYGNIKRILSDFCSKYKIHPRPILKTTIR